MTDTETLWFRMFYTCQCGTSWDMVHTAHCDDRCPSCNTAVECDYYEDADED